MKKIDEVLKMNADTVAGTVAVDTIEGAIGIGACVLAFGVYSAVSATVDLIKNHKKKKVEEKDIIDGEIVVVED